jgi:hypothetical protein
MATRGPCETLLGRTPIGALVLALGCGLFGYEPVASDTQTGVPGQGVGRPGDPLLQDGGVPFSGLGPNESLSPQNLVCAIGYADCDGTLDGSCEQATSAAVEACGACGVRCDNEHGVAGCALGLCVATCAPGFGDCDRNSNNGCEQPLDTVAHCGDCGVGCAELHAVSSCDDGHCTPTCASGFGDCDGDPNNGCEAALNDDPAHCGACANACAVDLICSRGSCVASPCAAGLGDCDGDPTTCEATVDQSLVHCGFCNNPCAIANGTPECAQGRCRVQGCDPGFDDCDGLPGNGCETTLATTTEHCGACRAACSNDHGNTSCNGSSCAPNCATGFGDCDGLPENGCETPLDRIDHCGVCDNVCPSNGGTPSCNAGVCGTICDLTGTFALKLTAPGSWPSGQYMRAGNGTFQYWLKAELSQAGTAVSAVDATVTLCGRVTPPVTNTANETLVHGYPNSLFDSDFIPSTSAAVTLSGSSPGSALSWPLTAQLMGISMANPRTDPWPTAASQVPAGRRIDMDRDGKTGMTGTYAAGNNPRTSAAAFGFNRADLFYFALRLSFSLSGSLTNCSASSGNATISNSDMRILGCNREGNTQDCTSTESDFLDSVTPTATLSAGNYALKRVTPGASCATVRSSLP